MLHTGTMLAVVVYFVGRWRSMYFQSRIVFKAFAWHVFLATALTGVIGEGILKLFETTAFRGSPHAEIEDLFSHLLKRIAASLDRLECEIRAMARAASAVGVHQRTSSKALLTCMAEPPTGCCRSVNGCWFPLLFCPPASARRPATTFFSTTIPTMRR
jgi:hypothetical protein